MSQDNLGNKQTIILHNCEINSKKYDLVITPRKQTIGHIRTKRQTITRKIFSKQRQITRKRFLKRRNAVSESETSILEELYRLKDSVKNYQVNFNHHNHQYKENEESKRHTKTNQYVYTIGINQ